MTKIEEEMKWLDGKLVETSNAITEEEQKATILIETNINEEMEVLKSNIKYHLLPYYDTDNDTYTITLNELNELSDIIRSLQAAERNYRAFTILKKIIKKGY